MPAAFVSVEGGECAGKTTQIRLLAEALATAGRDVVVTREPGGTPGAERLRELLLGGGLPLAPRAETLMHFAARADHVERVIRPALAADRVVISDRFFDSTFAYQGYGQGRADPAMLDFIRRLCGLAGLTPDLTLLIEVPRDVARTRLAGRGGTPDRYETETENFHLRVAEGFRAAAAAEPGRIAVLDGAVTPDELHREIMRTLRERLPTLFPT
ncbi:dTMP kinase [Rhizosaccharibacter radicis]|uniref:Thymidylate kinase n=1 Tax=Rhizosaccharibacter radicis TaxID=2782605 RepID=A0ABT1VYQ5_9PROT|nr:dTMP kinase [Acetobacteraceae bacterium KSS12]